MYKIGLNGFRDRYKGCRFLYKLKQLRWELRYAWRRAWEGFDDHDILHQIKDAIVEEQKNKCVKE